MPSASSGTPTKSAKRPEIQALRAIAVGMVVLYHVWPNRLPGGYIGVDVFFVISGYLITSHLWKSAVEGRLSLIGFYARRVRRLAPASITVSIFIVAGTYLVVPIERWAQFAKEVIASVLLVENWVLARDSVDYLASEASPSPVQHFWSLSAEEQFYLVWPLLIILLLWLLKRRSDSVRFYGTVGALSVIGASSFTYCVWLTATDPLPAYFVTPVRVWQFAAGAILGLIHLNVSKTDESPAAQRAKALVSWVGIIWLTAAGFLLDSAKITYPGVWSLAPVIGTLLVLIGGESSLRWGSERLLDWKPIQYLGDISYSVYLWHWPFVVFAPFVLDGPLTFWSKAVILILTFVAGGLSTRFVENTIRFSPRLAKRHILTGAVAVAVAGLFVVAPARALVASAHHQTADAKEAIRKKLTGGDTCFGALSLSNPDCSPKEGKLTAGVVAAAAKDEPQPFTDRCIDPLDRHLTVICHDGAKGADESVLVWGDSHAAAWASAFDAAGKLTGQGVAIASRQGCPPYVGAPTATVFRPIAGSEQRDCADRNAQILELITSDPGIKTIVLASYSTNYPAPDGRIDYAGTLDLLKQLTRLGRTTIVLEDVPMTGADAAHRVDIPGCLSSHLDKPEACNMSAKTALNTRGLARAIKASPIGKAVNVVDTSSAFCDDEFCYAALGGIPVYFDASHLSRTFSQTLGPWVAKNVLGH